MTDSTTFFARLGLLCLGLGVLLTELATAQDDIGEPVREVLLLSSLTRSTGDVFITRTETAYGTDQREVVLIGDLVTATPIDRVEVVFQVASRNRARTTAPTLLELNLEQGTQSFRFDWSTAGVPDDDYLLELSVRSISGRELARHEWHALVRTPERYETERAEALERLSELQGFAVGRAESLPQEFGARLALAELALELPTEDVFEDAANLAMGCRNLDAARAAATFRPTPEDASLPAGPIGLAFSPAPEDVQRANRLGLDVLGLRVALSGEQLPEPRQDLQAALVAAADCGIDAYVFVEGVDASELTGSPNPAQFFDSPAFSGVFLPVQPGIKRWDDSFRRGFIEFIKETYPDRFAINRAWNSRYLAYDEIEIRPELDNVAYQRDWQTYQRRTVTEDLVHRVRAWANAEGTDGLTVGLGLPDTVLSPGATRFGLDRRALMQAFPANTLLAPHRVFHLRYAMNFGAPELSIALHRTFNPMKRLVVRKRFDVASTRRFTDDLAGIARLSALEAYLAGADAVLVDPRTGTDPGPSSLDVVEGITCANLVAKQARSAVNTLRNAPGGAAILWSDTAAMLDGGEALVASVTSAFEGMAFSGLPVRFLSEEDLLRGNWHGADVLVIPRMSALRRDAFDQLARLLESDVPVIRASDTLSLDERGQPLPKMRQYEQRTFLIRGKENPYDYLEAVDELVYRGDLPSWPRPVNAFGYPLEGVRTIYAEADDTAYLYFANLRPDVVKVHLTSQADSWSDAVTGVERPFPRSLNSLEFVFLERSMAPVATGQ